MRILYLIRHAKSRKDIPGLKDSLRPLHRVGIKDAPVMARRLKASGFKPELVISSPAKRAYDTARIFARILGYPGSRIKKIGAVYQAEVPELLKVIKKISNAFQNVILVGHNPEFTDLVNYLTERPIENVPTCGVVGINFDVDSWGKIGGKKVRRVFIDSPKKAGLRE
jgi:phosphohistidine phosphatase